MSAIPIQIDDSKDGDKWLYTNQDEPQKKRRKTTVTPYVFKCFQQLPWAAYLYSQEPRYISLEHERQLVAKDDGVFAQQGFSSSNGEYTVLAGDVISVSPDPSSAWKGVCSEWFAYVQAVALTSEGHKLSVLW